MAGRRAGDHGAMATLDRRGRVTIPKSVRVAAGIGAGQQLHYISVNTQVLGMLLEAATGQKLAAYMEQKLWSRLGPEGQAR